MLSKFIEVCKVKTFYHVCGSGPPLIFLHGHRAEALRWDGFIFELSKRFKVFAPDLPGYGQTEELKTSHTIENYAEFTFNFINVLGIRDPIIFGGSMGGMVAIDMSLKDDSNIKKLGLFGTPVSNDLYKFSTLKIKLIKAGAKIVASGGLVCKILQTLVNSRAWFYILKLFLLSSISDPEIIKYEAERWRSSSMKIWGETLYESLNFNPFKGYFQHREKIKVPTLVIFSTGDKYIKVEETLKEYKNHFENLEVVEVDTKGHLPKGPVRDQFLENFKEAFARI